MWRRLKSPQLCGNYCRDPSCVKGLNSRNLFSFWPINRQDFVVMADECAIVKGTELPVKRPREEEEEEAEMEAANNNGCSANDKQESSPYISSVLPGWFSEISPLWPGLFFSFVLLLCFMFSSILSIWVSKILVLGNWLVIDFWFWWGFYYSNDGCG